MLPLPPRTRVNRFVPKETFYQKTTLSARLRQMFIEEVERITWTHKISPDTLNITSQEYTELQVFEITLKKAELSQEVLKHIDTFIPYPILFILKKLQGEKIIEKAVLAFKEPQAKVVGAMRVEPYYETPWQSKVGLALKGLSVDELYQNFLFQIAPILAKSGEPDLKTAVAKTQHQEKVAKQIAALNQKIAREPNLAKKQDLARARHHLEQTLI